MQDFIPKGNGNSRSLKSSIPNGTTWEQALEMLRNGTFPIDIGPVNDEGVAQRGSPVNKNTLLKDSTAGLFQLGADSVPDEVLQILSKAAVVGEDGTLVSITDKLPLSFGKAIYGQYTGNGNPKNSVKISTPFHPRFCFLAKNNFNDYGFSGGSNNSGRLSWVSGVTKARMGFEDTYSSETITFSESDTGLSISGTPVNQNSTKFFYFIAG